MLAASVLSQAELPRILAEEELANFRTALQPGLSQLQVMHTNARASVGVCVCVCVCVVRSLGR
jgi:hypothetical protein